MKGKINEVFKSMQGEGLYFGEEQIFVRFFGCNLSCKFCDTKMFSFTEYEPEELWEELKLYHGKHHSISFTGGEPLLQKDFLKEVLKLSSQENYRNYLETNGTLYAELKEVIEYLDIVAMDIKLPSSSGMGELWWMHCKFLEAASSKEVFLKAVICQATKEEDLMQGVRLIRQINKNVILVLQANSNENHGALDEKLERFKAICRQEKLTTCIIPQMHKIIGLR